MYKTDILIIGAGVVGLAVAEELSRSSKSVIVVEKNESFGQETSSRNSEVIHGGMYYPKNSLKARLCVRGRELLYGLCREHNIPHKKTGKLIVATDDEETAQLEELFRAGQANGVDGLKMLGQGEVKKLEPEVSAIAALHSAETGIVDSHKLMRHLLKSGKDRGVTFAFNSEVTDVGIAGGGYTVSVTSGGEKADLDARIVINSAGLDSDRIAQSAGIDTKKRGYELHYCKGQYFRLADRKNRLASRLVYPVPRNRSGGLGIHVTPDLAGSLRLGPDDNYLGGRTKDYSVDEKKRGDFYRSVAKFLPALKEADLFPDLSGIRPKLQPKGGEFRDFIIKEESDSGLPGFINLIGIESPGLTASLAIAEEVKKVTAV
ncbi:MAG: NAD(P)/FAD-dependent oxidoreductase [Candidatus Omnitrophica bacterium]|nr:NAD(P)/FAD-dependent oxidoreductase [Candidatus Omnitrophota bacterium]